MKKNKLGLVIIIEGFSGSGKSTLAKHILKFISKKIGSTVLLDGDEIRLFMSSINFKMGYTKLDRGKKAAIPVAKQINIFIKKNINVIYPNVGLINSATKFGTRTLEKLFIFKLLLM